MQQSKYRILGLVGQGQFGRVFCAIRRRTGELVALKDLEQRFPTNQFLRELRFLVSLQHPNIVACQAIEHNRTGRCLVMDYCEGGTLRDLMELESQLSPVHSLKLVADILLGLEHAHSYSIIHCDLKPENILLSLEPTGWVARISDFGIARLSQEGHAGSTGLGDTGSPAYMAPERFYGQYSQASDLYAVGVLLFELMVGQRPFSGTPRALVSGHLNQPVEIPDEVPFLLRSTISRALQKLPHRRFASAGEMLKSIRLAAEVLTATQPSTPLLSVPTLSTSPCEFERIHIEPLLKPINQIAVESQQIYLGMTDRIHCLTYSDCIPTRELVHQWQVQFTKPVVKLSLRPQGCFAITRLWLNAVASYSIYCLPRTAALSNSDKAHSQNPLERFALLSLQSRDLVTAIDPQGRWIAIAQPDSARDQVSSELTSCQATFQILKLPGLQPARAPASCRLPSQLISLNSRYGLAIFPVKKVEETLENVTLFQIFTRRGGFIGGFCLPLCVRQVTPSATSPYRLLAIEQSEPALGLLIDLKPLSVTRIALEINPTFVAATKWGYILADRHRQLLLLDREGHTLSRFELPDTSTATDTSQITAIAASAKKGLLIATWAGERSMLYKTEWPSSVTIRESIKS